MTAEEIIYNRVKSLDYNAKLINLPISEEWVTNNRGMMLHCRSWWPESNNVTAALFQFTGYSSHINRPTIPYIASQVNSINMAYITFDFHGHGYSEGERAYISDFKDLSDDGISVILAYNSDSNQTISHSVTRIVKGLPFYLSGTSMGGAISLVVGDLLNRVNIHKLHTPFSFSCIEKLQEFRLLFKGNILVAPAIYVNTPHWTIIAIMKFVVVPLIPKESIPSAFSAVDADDNTWKSPHYIRYVTNDGYPANPDGLSWSNSIRLGTAASILTLSEYLQTLLDKIDFPFLLLQDKEDKVTKFEQGGKALLDNSPSTNKTFIEVKDGLHDLTINRLTFVTSCIIDWLQKQNSTLSTTPNTI